MSAGSLDAEVCREHLGEVLAEECALLAELENLLEREYEVMSSDRAAETEQVVRARQERVGALTRIEEQRRSLCSMHGYSADLAGLQALMAWCDPQGTLLSRLRECAQRAVQCRDLNDRNGTLIAARLKRVEGLLGALTGQAAKPDTYAPRGSSPTPPRPGRVLGAA